MGLFFPQVGKFRQHFIRRAEIQGIGAVRVLKALGGQENMPEDLILRIQEVDIPRGNHGLMENLPQANYRAVKFPQLLLRFDDALFQHKPIICQGLDLQKIIEGSKPPEFILAFAIQDCLEQLPSLTGGADNQALPFIQQLGLGNAGYPLEVFQIRVGNQMVEVSQADLILGKQNNMPGMPVSDASLGPQGHHGRIDCLEGVNILLLFQLFHQAVHDKAAGFGIVRRPVMIEVRQLQGFGHNIQLEFTQLGQ